MNWYEYLFLSTQVITLISWTSLPIVLWKVQKGAFQKTLLLIILLLNALMGGLIFFDKKTAPVVIIEPKAEIVTGENWTIDQIFETEKDIPLRVWKRNLLEELTSNLNNYRTSKKLSIINNGLIESFDPTNLKLILNDNPEEIHLLDVREAAESDRFFLSGSQTFRYGDLANDIFPDLPKDKKIVVVCYSGIRGYVVANLLSQAGFENVSFIRGGLGDWQKQGLPLMGDEDDFKFLFQQYPKLPLQTVHSSRFAKIDLSFPNKFKPNSFGNLHNFYGELATTKEVSDFMEPFIGESVILICHTESECFDGAAFAYEFRRAGGSILGYIEINDR